MAIKPNIEEQFSRDAVFEGRLVLDQSKRGYRFSIDALLLTYFATAGKKVEWAADLGAGSGIVGLGLLAADHAQRVIGMELQPSLGELALGNARLNGLADRYELITGHIRDVNLKEGQEPFGLVVANPPFWPAFEGRMPKDRERCLACHEVDSVLEDWTGAATRIMHHRRGRFVVVFPARRLDCLVVALHRAHLSATRIQFVQPHANGPAELVLVEARIGGTGRVEVAPSLVLKDDEGNDTEQTIKIVRGDFSGELRGFPDRRPG